MNKKLLSLIICTLLVFCITISLVACGKGNDQANNENVVENQNTCTHENGYTHGKCVDCGVAYGDCDHEKTEIKEVAFQEYGDVCGGGIIVDVCADCGIYIPRPSTLLIVCNDKGENGECTSCNLAVKQETKVEDCKEITTISAKIGEKYIFEGITSENDAHGAYETIIPLDIFSCGADILADACITCDEVLFVYGSSHNGELTYEEVNGTNVYTCQDCGYKKVEKITTVDCTGKKSQKTELSIYNGESLVYTNVIYEGDWTHDFEYKTGFMKDTCSQGLFVARTCLVCGENEAYTKDTHVSAKVEVELSTETCGGTIALDECVACKQYTKIVSDPSNCKFKLVEDETTEDENGVYHYIEKESCIECGLVKITDSSTDGYGCNAYLAKLTKFFLNDEEYIVVDQLERGEHEYSSVSKELIGESCLDGTCTVYKCSGCGDEYCDYYIPIRHVDYTRHDITLEDVCGVDLYIYTCYCGFDVYFSDYIDCSLEITEETRETIDGIEYTIKEESCGECGAIYVNTTWEIVEGCVTYEYRILTIILNGETLFDSGITVDDYYSDHDYETTVAFLHGESCEEGIIITEECKDCGNIKKDYAHYHKMFLEKETLLSDYGACGGVMMESRCACGETEIEVEADCNFEYTHEQRPAERNNDINEYYVSTCLDCGLEEKYSYYYTYDGCTATKWLQGLISKDGNVIAKSEMKYDEKESHLIKESYEFFGESCSDGIIITSKCENCDYSEKETIYYCYLRITEETYFSEYGACGGWYEYQTCICGENVSQLVRVYDCNMTETKEEKLIDGNIHRIYTNVCSDCGLTYIFESWTFGKDQCYTYYTSQKTVTIGETIILDKIEETRVDSVYHHYDYTTKIEGDSCLDGYLEIGTCKYCGDISERTIRNHNEYEIFSYIDLYPQAECFHSITIYACPCGEYHSYNLSLLKETAPGVYSCESCKLSLTITEASEFGSCTETLTTTYKVVLDEEVLFEKSFENKAPMHLLDVNEADGVTKLSCRDCDYEAIRTTEMITLEESDRGTSYQYVFTPERSGKYTFYSCAPGFDTYLYIYNEDKSMVLWYLDNENDDIIGKNFLSTVNLEADTTYIMEVGAWNGNVGDTILVAMIEGEYYACTSALDENASEVDLGDYIAKECPNCHFIFSVEKKEETNQE